MIDQHTLETLEYPKVIEVLRGKCLTPYGNEEIERIRPQFKREIIELKLTEVSELKDILSFGIPFPLVRLEDSREQLNLSATAGAILEPKEILKLMELLLSSASLSEYDKESREKFPHIAEYLEALRAFPELVTEIRKTIDENGEVRDNASPALKRIRAEQADSRQRILSRLRKILADKKKQAGWQDDVVTIRNGRYVIPIPSGQFKDEAGILHDRSQSGATLYVEPQETVELNNKINQLFQEERIEIFRILQALTAEIGLRSAALLENCRLIGQLDRLHASALFSIEIGGHKPQMTDEARFDLKELRHPLLIRQLQGVKNVIPNDIGLDSARQIVLITGPNTGGKTISLKAVGLSLLMIQSGLHISADRLSTVGPFEQIFADIGDEQSIELSLSTYSSHIRNIIHGLKALTNKTLLLFDEIGVGTDPQEGSSLAQSIILYAARNGAKMLVTTHYSQLKTLATEHPEIENASLEFDRDTLSPTYRLQMGMPGSSYAVEIAGRLGMPEEICEAASTLLGSSERSLTALIASLEAELVQVRAEREKLTERSSKVEELQNYYETENEKLRKQIDEEKEKGLLDTQLFLDETRKEIERLVSDIRESQASKESLQQFHGRLKQRSDEVKKRLTRPSKEPESNSSYSAGDAVEILSLNQRGEIEDLIGKDKARVRVGSMLTTVEIRNLRKVSAGAKPTTHVKTSLLNVEASESNQIHLRGMTVDEAMENLERFLDRAVISGLQLVYVVHGKGTGKLRRMLTEYLKSHTEVKDLRLGNWNEGGAGVTVVKLKK
ncbi:MAG: endonuclease MutS2 [bacterium]|nr:endonuclease MutS2 [bacterium]